LLRAPTVRAALGVLASEPAAHTPKSRDAGRAQDARRPLRAFTAAGDWPRFQYVTARLWRSSEDPARSTTSSATRLCAPAITARRAFSCARRLRYRQPARTHIPPRGHQDVSNFVRAVRYIAQPPSAFVLPLRPSRALTVTSEEVHLHSRSTLATRAVRLRSLIREEAGISGQPSTRRARPWSMVVIPEAARRYHEIHTIIDFMSLAPAAHDELSRASLLAPARSAAATRQRRVSAGPTDRSAKPPTAGTTARAAEGQRCLILLGEPGLGKSTALGVEREALLAQNRPFNTSISAQPDRRTSADTDIRAGDLPELVGWEASCISCSTASTRHG